MSEHALKPSIQLPSPRTIFLILIALLLAGLIAAWFWMHRPIRPVVLNPAEQTTLDHKVHQLTEQQAQPAAAPPTEPNYQKGTKEIILSEKEINALLHQNTTLGDQLKLELAQDALHARLVTKLHPEVPILGGQTVRAKARFLAKDQGGLPALIAEDITVWGISLPNEWLGGLKGKNLLTELLPSQNPSTTKLPGVKQLQIIPGSIKIVLSE